LKQAWLVVFTPMTCIERLVESACGCVCCLRSSQHTTPSKKMGVAYNKVLSMVFFNHHFCWEWDINVERKHQHPKYISCFTLPFYQKKWEHAENLGIYLFHISIMLAIQQYKSLINHKNKTPFLTYMFNFNLGLSSFITSNTQICDDSTSWCQDYLDSIAQNVPSLV